MALLIKLLKFLGYGVLALIAISFFLPGSVHMVRQIEIAAPSAKIFNETNELKNWNDWSPWAKIDPNTKYTYSQPTTAGEGAYFNWTSNDKNVGNGKQTILSVKTNELIRSRTDFEGMGTSTSDFKFVAKDSTHTQVSWSFDMDLGLNPIMRFIGLKMESFVAPDYERGLANLKAVCEK